MEGKAVLFKRFADIEVFDIELATEDPREVIRACQMLEPTFGGINLLIFPDLGAGNIAYRLLNRIGNCEVIGPILMGTSRPVHVLQRGAEVNDIVNVAAIAAVDAQEPPPRRAPEAS